MPFNIKMIEITSPVYGLGDEMQQINPDGNPSILSDMINNALPPPMIKDAKTNELAVSHVVLFFLFSYKILNVLFFFRLCSQYFSKVLQNGSAESSESASTSSIGSNNSSHNKAPGSQLQPKSSIHNSLAHSNTLNSNINGSAISSLQSTINSNSNNSNLLSNPFQEFSPEVSKQVSSYIILFIILIITNAVCSLF